MRDPLALYEPTADESSVQARVLIYVFDGFVQAGGVPRLLANQLLGHLQPRRIGRFDVDELIDYRARRPLMTFARDRWEDYQTPVLAVHELRDAAGVPFLLLTGPEPDYQWERFIAAVTATVARLGVQLSIGLNAVPMTVPHTREPRVIAHASRRELIRGYPPWFERVQVPGSAGNLLEYRLGKAGADAMGFAVLVPHYLAQNDYPQAAVALLESVGRATGLVLPTEELRAAGLRVRAEIDKQIAQSQEAADMVATLESQYDAFVGGQERTGLLGEDVPLPSAEELAAEFERFLAGQGGPGGGPGGSDRGGPGPPGRGDAEGDDRT